MITSTFAVVVASLVGGPEPTPATTRAAVERALPLLAQAATGHADQKECFACHNQAFPMVAFAAARRAKLPLPDDLIGGQAAHVHEFLSANKEKYAKGQGTGGQADTAGWALFTLEQADHPADDVTAAVAEYLLRKDAERGHWPTTANRPPTEASSFATTFVAIRGLQKWGTKDQKDRVEARLDAARKWLASAKPKDTEDRVFRLRALHDAGAPREAVESAARELARTQRFDGGWGQLDTLPSDPYATATALLALLEVGGWEKGSPEARRAVRFLLRTQLADGSWALKSRSKPFQPYYESGFPHGKNQFIAVSASGWAAAALIAAGGETK